MVKNGSAVNGVKVIYQWIDKKLREYVQVVEGKKTIDIGGLRL